MLTYCECSCYPGLNFCTFALLVMTILTTEKQFLSHEHILPTPSRGLLLLPKQKHNSAVTDVTRYSQTLVKLGMKVTCAKFGEDWNNGHKFGQWTKKCQCIKQLLKCDLVAWCNFCRSSRSEDRLCQFWGTLDKMCGLWKLFKPFDKIMALLIRLTWQVAMSQPWDRPQSHQTWFFKGKHINNSWPKHVFADCSAPSGFYASSKWGANWIELDWI